MGPEAVVAAPSPGIRAPVPLSVSDDGLDTGAGTSNSSAVVSGLAALVRAEFPELDAANVIHRIVATSIDEGEPGRDDMFGFGVIDPMAALTADVRTVTSNQLLPGVTPEERAEALREAAERAGGTAGVDPPGGSGGEPPAPGSGEQSTAGGQPVPGGNDAADDNAADDETTLADWLSGLGLAVAGGILLGVGAHGVSTRSKRRRRAAAVAG
nr:S8 family serine peptidase [Micromonospora sp. DSM 115978]